MATRRTRIKGIANIPQRRKADTQNIELNPNKTEQSDIHETSNNDKEIEDNNKPQLINSETNIESNLSENHDKPESSIIPEELLCKTEIKNSFKQNSYNTSNNALEKDTLLNDNVVSSKFEILHNRIHNSTSEHSQHIPVVSSEKIKYDVIEEQSEKFSSIDSQENNSNVTKAVEKLHSEKNIFETTNVSQKLLEDINPEYPRPPPSPSKTNRARIKPVPRFSHRKTSFSASESEDDSKKINRIRNDSVCSATSVIEPIPEYFSPLRTKEPLTTVLPKRSGRTEQTRKLHEARREFLRKFSAKKPERHQLTMMDLIFYNPDSNPIIEQEKHEKEIIENGNIENQEENEEIVDDPTSKDNIKNEKENDAAVPQIKIGPSGEIILDEQSLVVERKDILEQREKMQKSGVIDADSIKKTYGIYKKHRRSKFWSQSETVLFYKALNTIGTDFMLMCELFPNRERRELKIKFKKEEKINRHLIDKALMQPCNFDFEDLKNEIEMEKREMELLRTQKEVEKKQKEKKQYQQKTMEQLKDKKRKADGDNTSEAQPKRLAIDDTENIENIKSQPPKRKVKPRKLKKDKMTIKTFMSDSDADESDIATQSEDEDVVLSRKPTRSGRMPKVIDRYDEELSTVLKKSKASSNIKQENIEPGSIMIITEAAPNGEPIYKIYMVTEGQKAARVELSSDMLSKALQLKKGVSAENIMTISANVTDDETELPYENNITIPADENVTSLRSNTSTANTFSETETVNEAITPSNGSDMVQYSENIENKEIMSKEPNTQSDLPQYVKVIATHQEASCQDNIVLVNDLSFNSEILLEVKNDGSCSPINNGKVGLRTENENLLANEVISLDTSYSESEL